jgi:hypothetical protein
MVQIAARESSHALAGYIEQVGAFTESERFSGASFYASWELALDEAGVIAHGALPYPRGEGYIILEGRNVEWAGEHAIPAAHTDRRIVSNCARFCLGVCPNKA